MALFPAVGDGRRRRRRMVWRCFPWAATEDDDDRLVVDARVGRLEYGLYLILLLFGMAFRLCLNLTINEAGDSFFFSIVPTHRFSLKTS